MNSAPNIPVVIMPVQELKIMIQSCLEPIQAELNQINKEGSTSNTLSQYITSSQFMEATKIRRSKFDHLIKTNQIKSIKKSRKIYIPTGEVDRFFSDSTIK